MQVLSEVQHVPGALRRRCDRIDAITRLHRCFQSSVLLTSLTLGFEVKSLSGSFKGWKGALIILAALDHAMPHVVDVQQAIRDRDNGEVAVTLCLYWHLTLSTDTCLGLYRIGQSSSLLTGAAFRVSALR